MSWFTLKVQTVLQTRCHLRSWATVRGSWTFLIHQRQMKLVDWQPCVLVIKLTCMLVESVTDFREEEFSWTLITTNSRLSAWRRRWSLRCFSHLIKQHFLHGGTFSSSNHQSVQYFVPASDHWTLKHRVSVNSAVCPEASSACWLQINWLKQPNLFY